MSTSTLSLSSSGIQQLTWPKRHAISTTDKWAVLELFDQSIASGSTFGYAGERENAYTRAFAEFLGGGFADAVNSGSNALYVALRALSIDPFHEVIVSPVTDPGGVMPIPLSNLIPVPSDTTPDSYSIGVEQIRSRLTPQTKAIVVTHISGLPADMTKLTRFARENHLYLIEDCAQAHGAMHQGQMVGTFGDVATFSMMHSKHHCMGGQGGMVFTQSEELSWEIRRASDRGKPFGLPDDDGNILAALNCSADELGCALGLAQLKKLPDILARRRASAADLAERCRTLQAVRMVEPLDGDVGSYWFILFKLDLEKVRVPKKVFVDRLGATGIPFWHEYASQPCQMPWYLNRRVFGESGYPWSAPAYKGNPIASYPTPNVDQTIATHFMLFFNENVGEQEVCWVFDALQDTEREFLI